MKKALNAGEEAVMKQTFKATMLRAADIIDKITADDVLTHQARLLASGTPLELVARVDRAMIAAAHLRACADGKVKG